MPPPIKAQEVILSDAVDEALLRLIRSKSGEAASILRRVEYLRQRLLDDCQEGEVIPCPLPRKARDLEARHGPIRNLYCCDLPGFWRLLYSIVRDEGARFVYVLKVVDHRTYDDWL